MGESDNKLDMEKPRLRGVFHQYGFLVSLLMGALLIFMAESQRALVAALIYALSLSLLLLTSTLYHRVNWSASRRIWMRRLDRAMIFVLIAGSYTPFGLLLFGGKLNEIVFWGLWASVLLGFLFNMVWISAPKWIRASLYVLVGWAGIPMLPELISLAGMPCFLLMLGGGVLYTVGAVFYALKKPNFIPGVFGYHELFHCLVLLGALVHYLAIALYVFS